MYDDILLPVAPEGKANAAVPHAESLAERYDATVHVVSAADTIEHTLSGPRIGSLAERVESAAQDRVDELTERLSEAGVDVEGHVVRGEPLDAIEDAIEETGADIVVMPSHTRKGLSRVLLGSVTEKVVRISPVPVVTVPMPSENENVEGADEEAE
ncbi:universal stress protein [Halorubrum gandharaense]